MNIKIFFALMLSIFLLGSVSALDFDNAKTYDEISKTATFDNWFGAGEKLADVRLDAVPVYNEKYGTEVYLAEVGTESMFAQFTITPSVDYTDILKDVTFLDLNTNKYISKPVIVKVKSNELVEKNIYDKVCYETENRTIECSEQVVGTEKIYEDVWLPIEKVDVTSGKEVTLSLYTEIKKGDYFDYVPKFYGEEVPEWAIVASDPKLLVYYHFNETTGNVINLANASYSSTKTGGLSNIPSKFIPTGNSSLNYSSAGGYLSVQNGPLGLGTAFTINFFINTSKTSGNLIIIGGASGGQNMLRVSNTTGSVWSLDGFVNNQRLNFATTVRYDTNNWTMITWGINSTVQWFAVNGQLQSTFLATSGGFGESTNLLIGRRDDGGEANLADTRLACLGIWNRSVTTTEITELWNGGSCKLYPFTADTSMNVTLNSPINNTVTTNNSIILNATINKASGNISNATFYVWYTNSTVFNVTTIQLSGNITNTTTLNITNLNLGNKLWNVYGCTVNETGFNANCSFAPANFTFYVGSTGTNNYNNVTYETSTELFTVNVSIPVGEAVTSARLVYNGTAYNGVTVTLYSSTLYILSKNLTIPLNTNAYLNETKNIYWSIDYLSGSNQNLTVFNQVVRYINLELCNVTFPVKYINFTVLDEINETAVNSTFQTTFSYYVSSGSGSIVKNYSVNNLSQTTNQYNLCFGPYNQSIIVSGTINFENTNYGPNQYSLSNANLNSNATQVNLYLIPLSVASKFYITVKQGVEFLTNNVVQIAKLFVGTNNYNTVSIRITDDSGQFPMYMDIDAKYQFTVLEDGAVLGVVIRDATCATAPCSMIVNIPTDIGNVFEQYEDDYARNILSNLSFNITNNIVTYTFIDTTGLAQYFRLHVGKASYNTTAGGTICDTLVYSSSGSITCNVSGYTGDFYAYGYIARSPEKIDKFISFLIDDDVIESLGLFAILITIAVLLTGLFGAVTLSRGNPSTVLTTLAILILLLKFAQIFPFSWTVVVALEAVIAFILFKLDS